MPGLSRLEGGFPKSEQAFFSPQNVGLGIQLNERMPRFKPKGMLERSALQDLWKHTLARIPTILGRLAYLASLRDPNSGIYRHHGLSAAFGREESGKALRQSHEQAFAEWLSLPLAGKHQDLMDYLGSLEDSPRAVMDHWLRSKLYRMQVPSSAREVERRLYFEDMEALLETARNGLPNVRPGAEPGPASSPPA